jgi:hypothetical protein
MKTRAIGLVKKMAGDPCEIRRDCWRDFPSICERTLARTRGAMGVKRTDRKGFDYGKGDMLKTEDEQIIMSLLEGTYELCTLLSAQRTQVP